jgi:hypothetical protein
MKKQMVITAFVVLSSVAFGSEPNIEGIENVPFDVEMTLLISLFGMTHVNNGQARLSCRANQEYWESNVHQEGLKSPMLDAHKMNAKIQCRKD